MEKGWEGYEETKTERKNRTGKELEGNDWARVDCGVQCLTPCQNSFSRLEKEEKSAASRYSG